MTGSRFQSTSPSALGHLSRHGFDGGHDVFAWERTGVAPKWCDVWRETREAGVLFLNVSTQCGVV